MTQYTQELHRCHEEIRQVHSFFHSLTPEVKRVGRPSLLTLPDIACITLLQAQYHIVSLHALYWFLHDHYKDQFYLPCYKNFIASMKRGSPFLLYCVQLVLHSLKFENSTPYFIDSTPLPVCKIYRASDHRTMKQLASKKKSTTGWFYGLKFHCICDKEFNIRWIGFTTGSCDDRVVLDSVKERMKDSDSVLVADGGYVGKKDATEFYRNRILFVTAQRKNMHVLTTVYTNKLLNMRSKIETVFSILKTKYNMVTSLPRSIDGYLSHYIRSVFSYIFDGVEGLVGVS